MSEGAATAKQRWALSSTFVVLSMQRRYIVVVAPVVRLVVGWSG